MEEFRKRLMEDLSDHTEYKPTHFGAAPPNTASLRAIVFYTRDKTVPYKDQNGTDQNGKLKLHLSAHKGVVPLVDAARDALDALCAQALADNPPKTVRREDLDALVHEAMSANAEDGQYGSACDIVGLFVQAMRAHGYNGATLEGPQVRALLEREFATAARGGAGELFAQDVHRVAKRWLADKYTLRDVPNAGLQAREKAKEGEQAFDPDTPPAGNPLPGRHAGIMADGLAAYAEFMPNALAIAVARQLDVGYVPLADDAVRFVATRPTSPARPDTSWLPVPPEAEFHVAENSFSTISVFEGDSCEPFTVMDVGTYGAKFFTGGKLRGRFALNASQVTFSRDSAALSLPQRMQQLVAIEQQRWRLPDTSKTFQDDCYVMRVAPPLAGGSAEPAIGEAAGMHVVTRFEGYEKSSDPKQSGRVVEHSPEAFRYVPSDQDLEAGISVVQRLGAQLAVMQWGAPQPGTDSGRAYYEALRIAFRVSFEHCARAPFAQRLHWMVHMAANPVPFLVGLGINAKKTQQQNRAHFTMDKIDGAQLSCYCKDVRWLVPEYVLRRCAPVSFEWVKRRLGNKLGNNTHFETVVYNGYEKGEKQVKQRQLTNVHHTKNTRFYNLSESGVTLTKDCSTKRGWRFAATAAVYRRGAAPIVEGVGEAAKQVPDVRESHLPEGWADVVAAQAPARTEEALAALEARYELESPGFDANDDAEAEAEPESDSQDAQAQAGGAAGGEAWRLHVLVYAHRFTDEDVAHPPPQADLSVPLRPANRLPTPVLPGAPQPAAGGGAVVTTTTATKDATIDDDLDDIDFDDVDVQGAEKLLEAQQGRQQQQQEEEKAADAGKTGAASGKKRSRPEKPAESKSAKKKQKTAKA
jgi:hypothetical protein